MRAILRDVVKQYGDKLILNSVNLEFSDNTRYAVVGASGIGKTTLLRLLAGLEKPDCGFVEVSTGSVISYAFQEHRLFPMLTVMENMKAIEPEKDCEKILDSLDLLSEADSYPSSLSGGMRKRAGLARALAKKSDIDLIDEPTGGQDARHCAMVAETISTYTNGSLSIIATHDAELIASVADYLIVLNSDGFSIHQVKDKTIDEIRNIM